MLTRRNFLRGGLKTKGSPLRPPWALVENEFLQKCTRCNACIETCPENILVSGSGFPVVDFTNGECTFCNECVNQCEAGALDNSQGTAPWFYRAEVSTGCLSHQGVVCQSCRDQCDTSAILFKNKSILISEPEIDLQNCNGCGACVQACPVNAITVTEVDQDILNICNKERA